MTHSMTQGSPLKLIVTFSLPLLAANVFQQLYNMVDAAIVGRILGADALAAVGATSSIQFLVLGFCLGSCVGFGIPIAQRFGAGDLPGVRSVIFHSAILSGLIAVVITLATALGCHGILYILQVPADIYDDTYRYIIIIFLGIPFTILYNLLASILRSVGDSKTPFYFVMFSSVLNIGLDVFTIVVLHWGVAGAAAATVFSQAVSGILCLITILRRFPDIHLKKADCVWKPAVAKHTAAMAIPTGLQFSITAIGSMIMQSANNSLGTLYVSGFTSGLKIKQFGICVFDAIAVATGTFAGQNYGAKKPDRIRSGIRVGTTLAFVYGIAMGLVFIFFGGILSSLFVPAGQTAVVQASWDYLRCMGYVFWLLGILNPFRQTIQSLGYAGRAIFSGAVEMVARSVISLTLVPRYGYPVICWTDQAAWTAAVVYIVITMALVLKKIDRTLAGSSPKAEANASQK